MSLCPQPGSHVPEETARVARAAFPKGNPSLTLRDELETLDVDSGFEDLLPKRGPPAESPGRLALIVVLQFAENLSDRQAAEAVRSRIDWKCLLGLDLGAPGFAFAILRACRDRLLAGGLAQRLWDDLLEPVRERGVGKAWGKQRSDATHLQAAARHLNRLECVGETMRQALTRLADRAPHGGQERVPQEWYDRSGHVLTRTASLRRQGHDHA